MQFRVNFTENISLIYNLVDHDIANHWSTLIAAKNIDDCCKINHYTGYNDTALVNNRIHRLFELVDIINEHVPRKIEKVPFSKETFTNALNTMHVHFPEFKLQSGYEVLNKQLSEYNDTIHWLEAVLPDFYNQNTTDNSKFSIKLDFNKVEPYKTYPIPESAYPLFNGYFTFGQLMLHYVHVGRHPWELFFANDLICPKDQQLPQSEYNASVRLHFYNNYLDDETFKAKYKNRWIDFYNARGGKSFFDYDIDDPRIRFGYCQIGKLSRIIINNNDYEMPNTITKITDFRSLLVKTKILGWEII